MNAVDPVWAEGVRQFHAECGGVLRLHLVNPLQFLELAAAAALGNAYAAAMLQAVQIALNQIDKAPRNRPALCLCCPRAIRKPQGAIVALVVPDDSDVRQAIASAICPRCVADNADLDAAAFRGLRRMWPEMRRLTVTHSEGGHA